MPRSLVQEVKESAQREVFFENSKLSLQQWLILMHWWCRQYPVTDASQEAKVTEATGVQAYQYFRDICSWRLLNRDAPLMLGGPGVIVQIDESLFRHKPKVELLYMIPIIICCNQIYFIFQNHRGAHQEVKFGCLAWWMSAILQHLCTCRLSLNGMPTHFSQSFSSTSILGQLSGVMNGKHTIEFSSSIQWHIRP